MLVPVDDVGALANVARDLRVGKGEGKAGALSGRARALQRFSAANLQGYLEIYEQLIGRGGPGR